MICRPCWFCRLANSLGGGQGEGQRLFDKNMFASLQGLNGQTFMGGCRGCYHHPIQPVILQHCLPILRRTGKIAGKAGRALKSLSQTISSSPSSAALRAILRPTSRTRSSARRTVLPASVLCFAICDSCLACRSPVLICPCLKHQRRNRRQSLLFVTFRLQPGYIRSLSWPGASLYMKGRPTQPGRPEKPAET